jgi:hypothetical protein
MPPTIYPFKLVDDLLPEKIAGGVGIKPLEVTRALDGTVLVTMPDALDAIEKTMLDDFMSTRQMFPQSKGSFLLASALLVPLEALVVNPDDFDLLGGAVTNPSYFITDVKRAFGLLVGAFRIDGDGAIVRIVEDKDGVRRVMGEFAVPNTGNAWKAMKFMTDSPSESLVDMIYMLEGTLGTAKSAAVRFVSLSLMETL